MEFPIALDGGPVNYAPKNPGVTAYGFAAIRPTTKSSSTCVKTISYIKQTIVKQKKI
jgi:hypothetical protein